MDFNVFTYVFKNQRLSNRRLAATLSNRNDDIKHLKKHIGAALHYLRADDLPPSERMNRVENELLTALKVDF